MKRLPLMVVLLSLVSVALAQTAGGLANVPDQYQYFVAVAIGYLSSKLVSPLTSIAKRVFKTEGVTTVGVTLVLGALVSAGFGFALGVYPLNLSGLGAALTAALTSIAVANGNYLYKVQVHSKAFGQNFEFESHAEPVTPAVVK